MSPTRDEPRTLWTHLGLVIRTVVVLGVILLPLVVTRHGCRRVAGASPQEQLAAAVAAASGLTIEPSNLHLLERRAGPLTLQPAVFRAREGNALHDLYVVWARLSEGGTPVSLWGPWNLSRTRDADEADLAIRGRLVACESRLQGVTKGVALYDLAGEPPALMAAWPWKERLLGKITNLQETGSLAGVGRAMIELRVAATDTSLTFEDDRRLGITLRVRGQPGRIVYDTRTNSILEGHGLARALTAERGRRGSYLTWAVDTVRSIPWVGPERIAWLEHVVFKVMDRLQVAGAKVTGYDGLAAIVEDLDLEVRVPPADRAVAPIPGWPPAPLAPMLDEPAPGEGHWRLPRDPYTTQQPGLPPPFAETFLRVDAERPFARVYLVAWDPRRLELHLVPGTRDPESSSGKPGSGQIPGSGPHRARLAAAFSGGWQTVHGHFGMRAQGTTVVRGRSGCATVGRLKSGATSFGTWPDGLRATPEEVAEFRQNLYALFEGGVMNPHGRGYWGGGHWSQLEVNFIRRSGLCATKAGHVVYFYGEHVSIYTLALAMRQAQCDYAMELDINRPNVSFEFYRVLPREAGETLDPPLGVHEVRSKAAGVMPHRDDLIYYARSLVKGQGLWGFPRYIRVQPRDFVYLTMRDVLPGTDLTPPVSPALPGEGAWQTASLPQGPEPFPAAIAITMVRPDPQRPDLTARILKIDLARVDLSLGRQPPAGEVLVETHLGDAGRIHTVAPGSTPATPTGLMVDGGGARPPRVVAGALDGVRATVGGVALAGRALPLRAAATGGAATGGAPTRATALPPRHAAQPSSAAAPHQALAAPALHAQTTRHAHATEATLATCRNGSFLYVVQVVGEEPAAAARALALCGCTEAVRLSKPRTAGHFILHHEVAAGGKHNRLLPGESALYVVARPRPSLVPMFPPYQPQTRGDRRIDGEAILKRSMIRSDPMQAPAPGGARHAPRPPRR